ncbi:MAG TPA: response regulator [Armatimonadetes bacterium]|nr:response regulator [Armatimonadota bacterium]
MRILIAEDDITSRKILSAVLRKHGHEVVETADGAEAWEALAGPDAPRIAILDWVMPQMDGVEVCRRLHAIPSDQPTYVIMLTSRNEREDLIEGLDAGANDYLSKPYDQSELRARVAVGCRMVELQAQLAAKIDELQDALDRVKTLQGILPICMHCKSIRDDEGYWQRVESYVETHSDALFSHGLCPDCLREFYPDVAEVVERRRASAG